VPPDLLPSRIRALDRVWKPLPGSSAAAYNHGYFHGITSGYPPEGYASAHPDWAAWMDVIGRLLPHGTLVDLGCAYGYLLHEAGRRGYRAFGVDTSAWALAQEPSLSHRLARADIHRLPLRSATADVVTLFDVLEHLERPWMCLSEAARILAPHGLLLGATPDPLFFRRPEPTHCFERPPAFWLKLLEELGFKVQFRFSGPAYNFQFLACREGSPLAPRLALFQHDYIAEVPDFIQSAPLSAVPRTGWGPLQEGFRAVNPEGASLYLYNPGPSLSLSFSAEALTTGRLGSLEIRLDDLPLARIHCTTEARQYSVSIDGLPLPEGGHHLHFRVQPPQTPLQLGRLRLQAHVLQPTALTSGLPFDLYQRYRLGAELAAFVAPHSMLDVGGLLGDQQGHMAVSRDFLDPGRPNTQVVSCDLRQADHWDHVPADALDLPFQDASFDLVLSLDVLEHVQPEQRHRFLAELARIAARALVIGCPEGTPAVCAAEARLSEGLMQGHTFLEEHAALGLPEPGMVRRFFEAQGFRVFRFPSGHLPAWLAAQALTQLFFRVPDWRLFRSWNEAYNRSFFQADLKDPAYRSIYLVLAPGFPEAESPPATIAGVAGEETVVTDSAAAAASQPELIPAAVVARFHQWVTGYEQALLDAQFLANARIELAELQSRQLDALMAEIRSLETQRERVATELQQLRGTPLWRLAWQRLRRRLGRST
jgi:SAM-dependent methyltransferase